MPILAAAAHRGGEGSVSRSSDSVAHISGELGFSSPSPFYRSFQKLAGTTPQAYRSRW
ncbi:helix-turn-helix domain-containing protein [Paenibacillus sp. D51F]